MPIRRFPTLFTDKGQRFSLDKEDSETLRALQRQQQYLEAERIESGKQLSTSDGADKCVELILRLKNIEKQIDFFKFCNDAELSNLLAQKFKYNPNEIKCVIDRSSRRETISLLQASNPIDVIRNFSVVIRNEIPFSSHVCDPQAETSDVTASFSLDDRSRVIALFASAENLKEIDSVIGLR